MFASSGEANIIQAQMFNSHEEDQLLLPPCVPIAIAVSRFLLVLHTVIALMLYWVIAAQQYHALDTRPGFALYVPPTVLVYNISFRWCDRSTSINVHQCLVCSSICWGFTCHTWNAYCLIVH